MSDKRQPGWYRVLSDTEWEFAFCNGEEWQIAGLTEPQSDECFAQIGEMVDPSQKKVRENGYYWVKSPTTGTWFPACWIKENPRWYTAGIDKEFDKDFFIEIDERRLERSAE